MLVCSTLQISQVLEDCQFYKLEVTSTGRWYRTVLTECLVIEFNILERNSKVDIYHICKILFTLFISWLILRVFMFSSVSFNKYFSIPRKLLSFDDLFTIFLVIYFYSLYVHYTRRNSIVDVLLKWQWV